MTDSPPTLHLRRHRRHWWMLIPAAAIVLIGSGAFLAAAAGGGDTDGWGTAVVGLGALAGVALVGWIVAVTASLVFERRGAAEVCADPIVRWPQYSTPAQWEKVVDDDYEALAFHRIEILAPLGIVTALLMGLGVWAAVSGVPEAAFPLGGFWLLFAGLVVGRQWNIQRERHADRRRREALSPYPGCSIARTGLYDEDVGLVTFGDLVAVDVIEPDRVSARRKEIRAGMREGAPMVADLDPLDGRLARSGWSLLELTFDPTQSRSPVDLVLSLVRRVLGGTSGATRYVEIVHVRVPPAATDEARAVAALLADEHGLASE